MGAVSWKLLWEQAGFRGVVDITAGRPLHGLRARFCKKRGFMATAVSSTKLRNAFSYCVRQVRTNDYENYLCALHLPPGPRAAAFALRAFNIETAQAGDMKETNLAMMRLAWWRDAVDGLYKKKTLEHPVVQALGAVINENRLSKHWFIRLLEARENVALEMIEVLLASMASLMKNII